MPPKYPPGQQLGAVVFGSDQGMCGPLNDHVVTHATRALEKLYARRGEQTILAVGARPAAQLETSGRKCDGVVAVPSSTSGIQRAVEELLAKIDAWHYARGIQFVVLFYARPVSGAWYSVRGERLLPIDTEWITQG